MEDDEPFILRYFSDPKNLSAIQREFAQAAARERDTKRTVSGRMGRRLWVQSDGV